MAESPEYLPTTEQRAAALAANPTLAERLDAVERLTVQAVAEWLQSIGSERHHSAFGDTVWAIPINDWERFIAKGESDA